MTPPCLRCFRRAFLAPLLGLCLAAALAAPARGDDDTLAAQRRIEAAYLFKFGSYITWPAEAFAASDSPLVIGIAGDDAMADELSDLVAGRNINGRTVQVQRVHAGDPITGLQILFVATGTPKGDGLIASGHNSPTVVVTEGNDGLDRGADMTFVLVNDRVRFDVSLAGTQHDGVKLSSQLLAVADKVTGTKP